MARKHYHDEHLAITRNDILEDPPSIHVKINVQAFIVPASKRYLMSWESLPGSSASNDGELPPVSAASAPLDASTDGEPPPKRPRTEETLVPAASFTDSAASAPLPDTLEYPS